MCTLLKMMLMGRFCHEATGPHDDETSSPAVCRLGPLRRGIEAILPPPLMVCTVYRILAALPGSRSTHSPESRHMIHPGWPARLSTRATDSDPTTGWRATLDYIVRRVGYDNNCWDHMYTCMRPVVNHLAPSRHRRLLWAFSFHHRETFGM